MTTKLTIYKSLLRDEILVEDFTEEINLSKAIHNRKELHGLYTSAWVNDTLIHPADWHLFELNTFDQIHLIGQPQKGALPYIGMVVGAIVAIYFAPAGAGIWAASAAALKGATIGYAIGSLFDGLLFPPTIPQRNETTNNPNYGWDGARLVTQPDGPVSIVYGQHRISGALIMQYVSTDGDLNYLHMLINLGEGEISGIMKADGSGVCTSTSDTPDIELNGQAYSSYQNVEWDYRLGEWNQSIIEGFHGTSTFVADGRKVSNGTPITVTTTGTDLTTLKIQVHTTAMYSQLDNGDIANHYVDYLLQYRLNGDPTWIDVTGPRPGGYQWIDGKTTSKIYKYVEITGLTAGQYDVKITRISPNYTGFKIRGDLYLTGITEQSDEDIAYRNSVLLSLKMQSTDQLAGSTPNVTAEVRGKVVSVPDLTIAAVTQTYDDCYWDDGAATYKRTSDDATCTDTGNYVNQWSRNPIWCTRDFILNTRYGLGNYIDSDSFDTTNAATEAKYCWEQVTDFDSGNEHRFEIDIPISTFMSAPESMRMLARTFRGWIIWSNGAYKPVIDRQQDPVWLFNASNMFPKTLKTSYFKASGIPNVVEIQYADKDRDYNLDTLEIVDENEWTSSKPLRKLTVSAIGTVRTSQNLRDGKYYLNTARYVTKAVEFEVPEYLLHVEPGDTVRISEDLLAWGVGGRIVSATSTSITTNIDITYSGSYEVRVRLPDNTLETKTVTSVTNNNRTLNISGSFTATPLTDSVFTYGATGVDSKPFKVKTITRGADDNYKILASEESSNKYNDTTGVSLPEPKYTSLPLPTDPPDNIEDLTLTEMSHRPGFYISFTIPQKSTTFHHVDFLLSLDNSNYWAYRTGVTTSSDIEVQNTKPGVIYYVKAISYNRKGFANIVPVTASITTMDTNFRPPQVNGLRLDGEATNNAILFTKKDAKFTWVKTSVTLGAGHVPAGQEVLGADQFFEEASFKYWVEIWVSGALVRKEIITDNSYVYTYEKNLADNGTISASLTIKVWGFNSHGNLRSSYSTDLAVSNPSPGVVTNLVVTGTSSATEFVGKDVNVSWVAPSDPDILNYKVVVTKSDDTVLRTEYSTDRFYTYDFNMNADDNSDVAINAVKINVYTQDWFGQLSSVTTISVSNPVPANVAGLAATALPRSVNFAWTRNSEPDIDHYTYRIQVESDGWSDWVNTNTNHISRVLTDTEISSHTSAANIQIEVKAVDTFGNESATAASANATSVTMDIAATDIDDFAITASKNFTKIPVLESDSWTNNSPGAGYVAWNEHNLYYNGAEYTITAGNTDKKYIYWLNGLSTYIASNTNPTLTDDDFMIAVNESGIHDLAWNAIANQVIGSAYIQDATVTNAKIVSLAAEKIVADSLSAISANLGTITAGYIESVEITSSTFQTSTSGKRIEITSDGITLHISDVTGKYGTNFKYGDGTKYGAGVLAYIQHDTQAVPFYVQAEQTVGDFHYFNRSSNPSGAAEIGDTAVVGAKLKICNSAGTPGTWVAVNGPYLYAADYGVDSGESAANNVTYLQAAIDAAHAAGGQTVMLPAGVISVDSAIDIGGIDNVTIRGCGIDATTIRTTSATAVVFGNTTKTNSNDLLFIDFTIDSSVTRTSGGAGNGYISFNHGSSAVGLTLQRMLFRGWYDGFVMEEGVSIRVLSCYIHAPSSGGTGIIIGDNHTGNPVAGVYISDTSIYGTRDGSLDGEYGNGTTYTSNYGMEVFDSEAIYMVNSEIGGHIKHNLWMHGTGTMANHHFTQTIFDATYDAAGVNISSGTVSRIIFTGCWFASAGAGEGSNTSEGFKVSTSIDQMIISGSRFYNHQGRGLEVIASTAAINVWGNEFHSNGGWDVYVDTGTNNASVNLRSNTMWSENADGSVFYSATSNTYIFSDNRMYDTVTDNGTAFARWGNYSKVTALAHKITSGSVYFPGGVIVGSPTGGDKGAGTINAVAVYDDNVLLTDYVLEAFDKGQINYTKWDQKKREYLKAKRKRILREIEKRKPIRKNYKNQEDYDLVLSKYEKDKAELQTLSEIEKEKHEKVHKFDIDLNFNIDRFTNFIKQNECLPAMPHSSEWEKEGNFSLGDLLQRLTETCEVQAVHIDQLNQRLKTLEGA